MGDVVKLENPKRVEALRGVLIHLQVADGTDVVVDPDSEITVVDLPEPEIPQAKTVKQ